jgi:VIT1/CCC1 family predicted Fe2+/Mn2+ transporter
VNTTSRRVLSPLERMSEILFGLIMVMTFTGSISVAEHGRGEIRDVLISALGCNLAWGIVDAGMYLMGRFTERARDLVLLKAIHETSDRQQAHRLIDQVLPSIISTQADAGDLDKMHGWLRAHPLPPGNVTFTPSDWIGALAVFLLVFLSTFPVVVPFLLMGDAATALRLSHGIAIAMLFLVGWKIGAHTGRSAWRVGATMVVVGTALAAGTMALGG